MKFFIYSVLLTLIAHCIVVVPAFSVAAALFLIALPFIVILKIVEEM